MTTTSQSIFLSIFCWVSVQDDDLSPLLKGQHDIAAGSGSEKSVQISYIDLPQASTAAVSAGTSEPQEAAAVQQSAPASAAAAPADDGGISRAWALDGSSSSRGPGGWAHWSNSWEQVNAAWTSCDQSPLIACRKLGKILPHGDEVQTSALQLHAKLMTECFSGDLMPCGLSVFLTILMLEELSCLSVTLCAPVLLVGIVQTSHPVPELWLDIGRTPQKSGSRRLLHGRAAMTPTMPAS